jgi:hypothetical protein
MKRYSGRFTVLMFALAFLAPATLVAQTTYFIEANKTIRQLGAQNIGTQNQIIYYMYFVEPLTQNCQNGIIYVPSERKALYATALSAKLSGRKLSRVDYSQPAGTGTFCNLELIEIND